jgi:hypothetical protein
MVTSPVQVRVQRDEGATPFVWIPGREREGQEKKRLEGRYREGLMVLEFLLKLFEQ